MKNTILLLSLFSCFNFANAEDYSIGNTNPIVKYQYTIPQAQHKDKHNEEVKYFTSNIANPKSLSKSNKYQYLINNADSLKGCWDGAAKSYGLDPWLLMAIAKVESSFNHKAINVNKNKSVDIGMMQINTIWLPTLQKFGITSKDLLNPCTSVFVGAWILAQNIRHFGYNQDGIGAYNSPKNVTIRRNYASKVYKAYNELTNDLYYKKING